MMPILVLLLIFGLLISLISWKISALMNDISILKQKAIEMANHTQEYIFSDLGISMEKQSQILKAEQPSHWQYCTSRGGLCYFTFYKHSISVRLLRFYALFPCSYQNLLY